MQVCMFCVTHLGHSHILLRRSQRLTRMRSCARRYALHRRSVTSLLRIEKFEERIFILPAYSCCRWMRTWTTLQHLEALALEEVQELACLEGYQQVFHLTFHLSFSSPSPVAIWRCWLIAAFPDLQIFQQFISSMFPHLEEKNSLSHLFQCSFNLGLDFNNLGDSELQNLLNNMSQQQLMQVLLSEILPIMFSYFCLIISCLEAHWEVAMPQVLPACWVGQGDHEWDRSQVLTNHQALSMLALLSFQFQCCI